MPFHTIRKRHTLYLSEDNSPKTPHISPKWGELHGMELYNFESEIKSALTLPFLTISPSADLICCLLSDEPHVWLVPGNG